MCIVNHVYLYTSYVIHIIVYIIHYIYLYIYILCNAYSYHLYLLLYFTQCVKTSIKQMLEICPNIKCTKKINCSPTSTYGNSDI
jgi:hypothetical protein